MPQKRAFGTVESIKNNLQNAGKYDKRDIEKALAAACRMQDISN